MADWIDDKSVWGDQWTLAYARTDEELAKQRGMALFTYSETEGMPVPDEFTCDACSRRHRCKLVFDLYSTNGDCLWEK